MPYIPTDQEFNSLIKEVEKLLPARRVLEILFTDKESKLDKHLKNHPAGSNLSHQGQARLEQLERFSTNVPDGFNVMKFLDPKSRKNAFENMFALVDELDTRTKEVRACCRTDGTFNYHEFVKLPVPDQDFQDIAFLQKQVDDYVIVVEILTSMWD